MFVMVSSGVSSGVVLHSFSYFSSKLSYASLGKVTVGFCAIGGSALMLRSDVFRIWESSSTMDRTCGLIGDVALIELRKFRSGLDWDEKPEQSHLIRFKLV